MLLLCGLQCTSTAVVTPQEALVVQQAWLANATAGILFDCRLNVTRRGREGTLTTTTTVFTPQACVNGNCHYKGQWLRDFAYGVEHAFQLLPSHAEAVAAAKLLFDNVRPSDGAVAVDLLLTGPPDTVPAWHFEYGPCPLAWEDPCRTMYNASNAWSKMLDGGPFSVRLAAALSARPAKAVSALDARAPTLLEEYAGVLVRSMDAVPLDPSTGLVVNTPALANVTYGFTDTVIKEGAVLYTSILYFEAAGVLAGTLQSLGRTTAAALFRSRAAKIKANIVTALWSPANSAFFASTGVGGATEIDVWGTAYALAAGLVEDDDKADRICKEFLQGQQDKLFYRGHVRHLPSPHYWPVEKNQETARITLPISRSCSWSHRRAISLPAPLRT